MGRPTTAEGTEQQYIEVMGLDLGRPYHRLWSECVWLHLKWNDYTTLFGTKSERIDMLNSAAPAFFKLIQDTMWEAIILHICRLTDPPKSFGKENLTLQCLPDLISIEAKPKLENLLNVAKDKCTFASDWRNRHIAHRDFNLVLNQSAEPLAFASRRSVIDALEAIGAVLNAVEFQYTGSTVGYEHASSHPGGAESLLYVLRDGIEAEAARRGRWRAGQALPEDYVARPEI